MGTMPNWGRTYLVAAAWAVVCLTHSGCTSPIVRSQNPDPKEARASDEAPAVRTVGDVARPWGTRPQTVEGIALVTNLDNTGSDPPANGQREMLLDDMKRRGVDRPNALLALKSTSLVVIRAQVAPGARKGDRVDVEVRVPTRSETTSLRNGWLMPARLQEMAVLGNRIRSGSTVALSEGSVVVNTLLEGGDDDTSEARGRILGGGVILQARTLGLILKSEHHSVRASAMVGSAINQRFHTYDRGEQRGVANPKRDNYIELTVHSSYRHNLYRYLRVIQAIPVRETPREMLARINRLEGALLDPKTCLDAAIELEAIGEESTSTLQAGLNSSSPIVRFASAESLAYLGKEEAIPHLTIAARDESAFRWHALTALGSMVSSDARESLAQLLHDQSAETRYGAFRAILNSNPRDPAVQGSILNDTLALHEIATQAEPIVHVRRTERPEVVLFGSEIKLQTPCVINAGKTMLIQSEGTDRLKVSHFTVGKEAESEFCNNQLSDLIRTIAQLGGSYTDVVEAINDAKQRGYLSARVAFDALPRAGREYQLDEESESDATPESFDAPPEVDDLEDEPQSDEHWLTLVNPAETVHSHPVL